MRLEGLGHQGDQNGLRASRAVDKEDERGLVPTEEGVVQSQHGVAVSGSATEVKVLFRRLGTSQHFSLNLRIGVLALSRSVYPRYLPIGSLTH